jgi:hypothetical protein
VKSTRVCTELLVYPSADRKLLENIRTIQFALYLIKHKESEEPGGENAKARAEIVK